jgi:hypothetical protein
VISAITQLAASRRLFLLAAFVETSLGFVSLVFVLIACTRPLPPVDVALNAMARLMGAALALLTYFIALRDAYRELRDTE